MTVGAAAERRILLGLAAFAMIWAVARAYVQAITIDEAVTYLNFVFPTDATYWTPHTNNHVLNSILARISTRIFGASPLAVRGGALTGAALFITASYRLTALLNRAFLLRVSLFVCLVFNPFIFDFLVAARGYGLAAGFLLWAICLVAYAKKPDRSASARSLVRVCVLASVCVALSLLSNFSFAFVDAATLSLLYLWASGAGSFKTRAKLAAACFVPCLLTGAALIPLVRQWKEPLAYGATSLSGTFKSLFEASFYEVPPWIGNLIFVDVPGVILPVFAVLAVWRAALIGIHWRSVRNAQGRWSVTFASLPIAAAIAALFTHWVIFRIAGTPLPLDRTAIYVVVLTTLFLGNLAAVPILTRAGDVSRRGLTILLVVLGSYFLLCLRVSYFKEWKWDSDTDKLYSVVAYYNRACGLNDIATNWRYNASLNFYRVTSTDGSIPEFVHSFKYPAGKRAYVLYEPEDGEFVASRGLIVAYRAPSGAAVALDPAIDCPPATLPPSK